MALDIGTSFLEVKKDQFSPAVKKRIEALLKTLGDSTESLFQWVASPQYAPDHPFGNKVMKECEKDFAQQKFQIKNE